MRPPPKKKEKVLETVIFQAVNWKRCSRSAILTIIFHLLQNFLIEGLYLIKLIWKNMFMAPYNLRLQLSILILVLV